MVGSLGQPVRGHVSINGILQPFMGGWGWWEVRKRERPQLFPDVISNTVSSPSDPRVPSTSTTSWDSVRFPADGLHLQPSEVRSWTLEGFTHGNFDVLTASLLWGLTVHDWCVSAKPWLFVYTAEPLTPLLVFFACLPCSPVYFNPFVVFPENTSLINRLPGLSLF